MPALPAFLLVPPGQEGREGDRGKLKVKRQKMKRAIDLNMIKVVSGVYAVLLLASCTVRPDTTTPVATATPTGEGFAIYLTARDVPPSQMEALSHIEPAAGPVIALDDIVSYTWKTHEIELTGDAIARLNALQVPTSGKSFVVCVDRQPVYWGAFWVSFSSLSFDGITIVMPLSPEAQAIQIGTGYPSGSFFTGADPRDDSTIMASLEKAGKLK
jgi:hypothetical protein